VVGWVCSTSDGDFDRPKDNFDEDGHRGYPIDLE